MIRKVMGLLTVFLFSFQTIFINNAFCQTPSLSGAAASVGLSESIQPVMIRGMKLNPENGLNMSFIIDSGSAVVDEAELQKESEKLIKYFLAALTIPEKDLWVNLSPYEKERIIADGLGKTEMGRDMLALDYMLKQMTSALLNPEGETGKEFWNKVHTQIYEKYGQSDLPVDSLNKVWIMPQTAEIFAQADTVLIINSRMKVMLEGDYLATDIYNSKREAVGEKTPDAAVTEDVKRILREAVIPVLEQEVNEGEHFAQLRQIYHSLLLAKWYKDNLKTSILNRVYSNQEKVSGVDHKDANVINNIYDQYVEAFRKGSEGLIKEDYDPQTQALLARKYVTGGENFKSVNYAQLNRREAIQKFFGSKGGKTFEAKVDLAPSGLVIKRRKFFLPFIASIIAFVSACTNAGNTARDAAVKEAQGQVDLKGPTGIGKPEYNSNTPYTTEFLKKFSIKSLETKKVGSIPYNFLKDESPEKNIRIPLQNRISAFTKGLKTYFVIGTIHPNEEFRKQTIMKISVLGGQHARGEISNSDLNAGLAKILEEYYPQFDQQNENVENFIFEQVKNFPNTLFLAGAEISKRELEEEFDSLNKVRGMLWDYFLNNGVKTEIVYRLIRSIHGPVRAMKHLDSLGYRSLPKNLIVGGYEDYAARQKDFANRSTATLDLRNHKLAINLLSAATEQQAAVVFQVIGLNHVWGISYYIEKETNQAMMNKDMSANSGIDSAMMAKNKRKKGREKKTRWSVTPVEKTDKTRRQALIKIVVGISLLLGTGYFLSRKDPSSVLFGAFDITDPYILGKTNKAESRDRLQNIRDLVQKHGYPISVADYLADLNKPWNKIDFSQYDDIEGALELAKSIRQIIDLNTHKAYSGIYRRTTEEVQTSKSDIEIAVEQNLAVCDGFSTIFTILGQANGMKVKTYASKTKQLNAWDHVFNVVHLSSGKVMFIDMSVESHIGRFIYSRPIDLTKVYTPNIKEDVVPVLDIVNTTAIHLFNDNGQPAAEERDFIENRYVRIAPDSEYDALKIHREYAHILSQMEKENTLAQDLYSDNVKLFQQISSGALVLNASLEQIQEMVKKFELSKRLSQNVIKNIELLEGWPLDKQYSIFLHMSNGKTSFEQSLKGKKVLMARITSIEGYLSAAPRSNQAMLVENTGGIDFDTSEMTAQTSGKGLDIQIKDSLGDIDPAMIQGIIPVNIRLTPITNIGVLFGKADGDKESSDEDMNLSTAILNKLKNYV